MSDYTEHEYTQGVCQDGAAILKDGQPMTVEQIVEELRLTEEMARCLNECLDQVNEAITVTMRSGNRGVLKVNGKKLTPGQVAERLEYLSQQRDRILKALNPQRSIEKPPEKIK